MFGKVIRSGSNLQAYIGVDESDGARWGMFVDGAETFRKRAKMIVPAAGPPRSC